MIDLDVLAVGAFVAALALWTVFAGAETTLAEARAIARTAQGPHRLGRLFDELHRHPRRLLIALALGRELALVATAALGVLAGYAYGGPLGGVIALGVTALLLLVSRGFAAGTASRRVTLGRPGIVPALMLLLAPLIGIATLVKRVGRRLVAVFLGAEPTGDNIFATEELAALTDEAGDLAASERTLVAKVVTFGDRSVRHIMTPRRDIIGISVEIGYDELLRLIRTSGCSRIPVYRGEKDDVIGILYVKDVIGQPPLEAGVEPILRQPYVVPAEKLVGELFREFRTRKVHIALVLDEYGSLLGLVTMEDVLEELFGEIRDEFDDDEEPTIVRRGPSSFVVSGRTSVTAVNARLKLKIPLSEHEATIAGVVIDRLGRLPDAGETLRMDGFTVTIEELDGPAIERMRVDIWPSPSSS